MTAFTPRGEFIRPRHRPIKRVIWEVSQAAQITPADILGRERTAHVVRARFAAMAICRDYLGLSYPAIGRAFKRDHTSVINAMRRVDAVCTDTDLDDMEAIARRAGLVEGK